MRSDKPHAVSDWLNPHSVGTVSAFGSIANLDYNSTCLISYQEITSSITLSMPVLQICNTKFNYFQLIILLFKITSKAVFVPQKTNVAFIHHLVLI